MYKIHLPAQALQLCSRFESPQNVGDSAASKIPAASGSANCQARAPPLTLGQMPPSKAPETPAQDSAGEKNYTQTYSKREHFFSSPYNEPQAPARRPAARNNLTPRHMGRGQTLSDWVLGIIKQGYTLQFARRLPQFCGVVSTSV